MLYRPASQHLFRLAAEAEGITLALDGVLQNYGQLSPETRNAMRSARANLAHVTKQLLDAGNEMKGE